MRESENDCLNNKEPKLSNGKPYIICAAIWFNDKQKHEHQPRNIDEGLVVCGRRHHNIYLTFADIKGVSYKHCDYVDHIQGFMTSDDRFVDRKQGATIAFEVGQTEKFKELLFSEDLY